MSKSYSVRLGPRGQRSESNVLFGTYNSKTFDSPIANLRHKTSTTSITQLRFPCVLHTSNRSACLVGDIYCDRRHHDIGVITKLFNKITFQIAPMYNCCFFVAKQYSLNCCRLINNLKY